MYDGTHDTTGAPNNRPWANWIGHPTSIRTVAGSNPAGRAITDDELRDLIEYQRLDHASIYAS
jgi:hypothetical protein